MATYNGSSSANTYRGTSSADTIKGNGGNDLLYGNGGNDTIYGGTGNDKTYGGIGNDKIYGEAGNDTIYGDQGLDVISGGDGIDVIAGGTERDRIWGDLGNDRLYGGDGNDDLYGGGGNDLLEAGAGSDLLDGGAGNDTMQKLGSGTANVLGGDGADIMRAPRFDEGDPLVTMTFRGGNGDDQVSSGIGNDQLYGDADQDFLLGGWGNDRIEGGTGNDDLRGEGGVDIVLGGDGNDTLSSGDTIYSATSKQMLTGGNGNDVFRYDFKTGGSYADPSGEFVNVNDFITDFRPGQDKLHLSFYSSNEADGTSDSYWVKFADLDTSGNGFITDADEAVDLVTTTVNGVSKSSLSIDVERINVGFYADGTITLYGVTALTLNDLTAG